MKKELNSLDEAIRELVMKPEAPISAEHKSIMLTALLTNPTDGDPIEVDMIGLAANKLLENPEYVKKLRSTPFADGVSFLRFISEMYTQYKDYMLKKQAEDNAA